MSDEQNPEAGAETPPSWKNEFRLRSDLGQRDFYAFEMEFTKLGGFTSGGNIVHANRALKGAIHARWLEAPAAEVLTDDEGKRRYLFAGENVDDIDPGRLRHYGNVITSKYIDAQKVPPN